MYFTIRSTRQASSNKLQHIRKSGNHSHNRLHASAWNALPIFNYKLLHPVAIKYKLQNYFYNHFKRNFVSIVMHAHTLFHAQAVIVANHAPKL